METESGWIPNHNDTFADRLKSVRLAKKMGQVEFATAIGASHASVSQWERGTLPRDLAGLVNKIHEEFGTNREWLIGLTRRSALTCAECGNTWGYCACDAAAA